MVQWPCVKELEQWNDAGMFTVQIDKTQQISCQDGCLWFLEIGTTTGEELQTKPLVET